MVDIEYILRSIADHVRTLGDVQEAYYIAPDADNPTRFGPLGLVSFKSVDGEIMILMPGSNKT